MRCEKILVKTLIIAIVLLSLCEARGGRRGGSFGGLFGSWRKYKKPSSGGGSSRRIVSSSPVHTPITKAMHENKKSGSSDKFQKNIKANNYYNSYNTPPLPTGGSYYHNTAALPGNAIYVAQAPPRGAEFGDFLTGYLTGRLLTMGFSSPHHHVTHVYRDNPTAADSTAKSNNTSAQVVIINGQQQQRHTEKPFNAPLVPISTTTESSSSGETKSNTTQPPLSTTEPPAPTYGVICMPMMINETDVKGEIVQIERTICYPAPAPPTPQKDMKSKPAEIAGDIMEH